ncbi:MAG TPA: HD domain-containing protein [Pirellulales bacterium]|nr:HD domain-containing protein [Pirellulales bacterium]
MSGFDVQQLAEAISFAARAHQGHLRKDGRTPYAAHPMRVLMILAVEFGVDDRETLAAAVLHDTIEDTRTDHDDLSERFGPRVADYVAALSKDTRLPEDQREREYLAGLLRAPIEVKLCKLGDIYDNLSDCATLEMKGRQRQLDRAREVLAGFRPDFPERWRRVLELV